jgi:predicted O-methyltransferase YrrM
MPPNQPQLDMKANSRVRPLTSEPDLPVTFADRRMDQAASRYIVDQTTQVLAELITHFGQHRGSRRYNERIHALISPTAFQYNFPQRGSTTPGGLLILYLIVRKLQPEVIVESGTFAGASLHALRKACPNADIWSFDTSFKPLRYRDVTIKYCECDWSMQAQPTARSDHDFVFFDDHIDNAKRIVEAHRRGFRYLLFDDAATFGQVSDYRFPGVPTIPMIMDPRAPRMTVSWVYEGTWLRYDHDPERCEQARRLVDLAAPIPDVRPAIGDHAGDKWLVRLK